MAIGWIGLLKSVPWGEVVSNAPKIASGARSLWNTVSKKIRADETESPPDTGRPAELPLATRITTLENNERELRQQLASASELIGSLADQNAQLVTRLDALRRRLRWVSIGLLLVGGLAVVALLKSL